MATDKQCIDYALLCLQLADKAADNPQLRERLLEMARQWMAVAAKEESPST